MPIGWKQEIVTYTGNGANDRTIPTSFALDTGAVMVWVHNSEDSDRAAYVRTSDMPAGQSQTDGIAALPTDKINSFSASGFVVDAPANLDTIPYLAVVLRDTTGLYLKVGSYAGTGLDDHNIDVNGGSVWAPEAVWTFNRNHVYRLSTFPSNATAAGRGQKLSNAGGQAGADSIQAMTATGFQVGTEDDVNKSGDTIYYAALKGLAAPDFAQFTTDGVAAPYELTGLGFGAVPGFVLAKKHGGDIAVWRGATTHTGTVSQAYSAAHDSSFGIKAVGVDVATFGAGISTIGDKFSGWVWPTQSSPDTLQFFTYGAISL